MDYEEIFNSVFENAGKSELGCFLRNPDVPFEYCLKAIKRRRPDIGWRNRLAIAMRPDCPEETLVNLCRGAGERFGVNLVQLMKRIPDAALEELHASRNCWSSLMSLWYLPDGIKRDMLGMILECHPYSLLLFLDNQCALPDDCIQRVDEFLKRGSSPVTDEYEELSKSLNSSDFVFKANKLLSLIRKPCDEEYAMRLLDGKEERCHWNKHWDRKLACNPSISELVEMELRVKHGHQNEVDKILELAKDERERYRRRRS